MSSKPPTNPADFLIIGAILSVAAGVAIGLGAADAADPALMFALGGLGGAIGSVLLGLGIVGQGVKVGMAYHEWETLDARRQRAARAAASGSAATKTAKRPRPSE